MGIVGWAATPNVAQGKGKRGAPNANRIPTNLIMMKGLRVIGCPAAISIANDPSIMKRRLEDLNEWMVSGRLPAMPVAATFELEDVKAALRSRVQSGSVAGSTIV